MTERPIRCIRYEFGDDCCDWVARILNGDHSSHCRSWVSLTRSRKQPRECMLSNTSGSSSVRERILLTHTRLGGGCSGHGSLRPDLTHTHTSKFHIQTCQNLPIHIQIHRAGQTTHLFHIIPNGQTAAY